MQFNFSSKIKMFVSFKYTLKKKKKSPSQPVATLILLVMGLKFPFSLSFPCASPRPSSRKKPPLPRAQSVISKCIGYKNMLKILRTPNTVKFAGGGGDT